MPKSTRPTLAPTFDPAAYARESEAKLRRAAARDEALEAYESAVVRVAPPPPPFPLDRVLRLAVPVSELRRLALDHRAGFLLSLTDGASSVEMVLDLCAMPREEALAILSDLVQRGVLTVG